jgi:hypothetical protein
MTIEQIERIANMNVKRALQRTLSRRDVQDFITNLNTEVQLFENNEDSLGVKLFNNGGEYSPNTVKRERKRGSKRIDLKDTGALYASFTVKPKSDGDFIIDSDPIKNGKNIYDRWGQVEGLTNENLILALRYIEEKLLHELLQ